MYRKIIKPTVDFIAAFILLVILSPILLITSIILMLVNRGPVFFVQNRPGYKSKRIKIIKFKTMKDLYDKDGHLLEDGKRLTKVGSVLRKLSIDELPQLLNVLKGDLSLIGPRPLLEEYLPLYSPEQMRRHEVRPGITGWAQVNGRNRQTWEERFELDTYYVDHLSPGLDLRILFLTFVQLMKTSETSSAKSATMEKFTGNKKLEQQ